MMLLKVDENLPVEVASLLRDNGHDATTVADQRMGGKPDAQIGQACRQETRVLVTLDLDFSDIRTHPPSDYPGIIVFRLGRQDKSLVLQVTERLLPLLKKEPIAGRLWIVDEYGLRVRDGKG
jgi:predicted nuclease of predicted toxin-antitoxin system